ncbi:MAG: sugar transferase [Patescibacteria group bacterium]|nr:sugar transferase [Patescibacteria group bacterium]
MNQSLKKLFFLLGDIVVLHLALALTLFVRYRLLSDIEGITPHWQDHWYYFIGVFIIFLLVFYINNLYSLRQMASERNFIRRTLSSVIVASLVSIIYFYIYPQVDIAPKTNLVIFALIALTGFLIWRRLAYLLLKSSVWQNNLAIIGYNEHVQELVTNMQRRPGLGYQTALIFKDMSELKELRQKILDRNIRTVILADDFGANIALRQILFSLLRHQVSFISFENFYEQVNGKVPVENINQDWFLENLAEAEKNYFDFTKRSFDYILAAIFFLVSLPLWILIAILIKLNSAGPILFTQMRVGKNGRLFKLYKFRTMRVNDNDGAITAVNDKRITLVGKLLRSTRLDEIPQLINILKGQMSFIGPRPERPDLSEKLEAAIPFYTTRLLIKPGISGWDQISGEYHSATPEDTIKKLQNDLYYIKHRSVYLDFSIVLKTVATVLGMMGR